MPDGRMVSKSIAHSVQLGAVSIEADYLFSRCIPHLDCEGRMSGHPALVKATACPLRPEITAELIPDLLRQLSGAGLVQWYEADGKQVLAFPGFKNHQRGTRFDREAPSRYPEPPSEIAPDPLRTNSGPRAAKVEVKVEGKVEVEDTEAKASEAEASKIEADPSTDDAAFCAALAPMIRDHLWGGDRPPTGRIDGKPIDMGRELSIAKQLRKKYGLPSLIGAIENAREVLQPKDGRGLSLLYFNAREKQQHFQLCVAHWRAKEAEASGDDVAHLTAGIGGLRAIS